LKKAGRAAPAPLVLGEATADGWVLFHSGNFTLATWASAVRGLKTALVTAVAIQTDLAAAQPAALTQSVA
jgi:hypothetical protein